MSSDHAITLQTGQQELNSISKKKKDEKWHQIKEETKESDHEMQCVSLYWNMGHEGLFIYGFIS